ncbi:hypothetical protein K466DRAFT_229557 [Polyporus arcularius HHB13444]|uniref:Uncharacterized protein n=1 Tax=Polyporus arcularius HHB13444 TaxID=1314778 RepID=A0A5C3P503_9APHY|nr:hypothetical protein K466DRAFT_229557 [Polyporus arcularius HHB13444]
MAAWDRPQRAADGASSSSGRCMMCLRSGVLFVVNLVVSYVCPLMQLFRYPRRQRPVVRPSFPAKRQSMSPESMEQVSRRHPDRYMRNPPPLGISNCSCFGQTTVLSRTWTRHTRATRSRTSTRSSQL